MVILMRILMVTDFYWPFLGGVEQHVRTLSHALHERGHHVAVATLWSEGLAEEEIDKDVVIYRVGSISQRVKWLHRQPQRPWAPPFPDPQVTNALRQIILREQPEIVHGHDWLARSFLPLKGWSGAKLVMSLHYYTRSCAKKNLMFDGMPCVGPAPRKCMACAARHYGSAKGMTTLLANQTMGAVEDRTVDLFVSVSEATAEGNRLTNSHLPQLVIPNFLPTRPSVPDDSLDFYTEQLPQGDFLLFVGDLRPIKGLEVLLAAYEALVDAPPLVLIGKVWPDTPTEFPPNIHILREWPNPAVMEAWRRSTIALVPSLWPEPFGIVVIEAMAGGTPVIASRIGGIPEIVVDGESGLLVPAGDVSALQQAIERLLQDKDLRQQMEIAAKARATDFSTGAVVPQIEAAYYRLLAQKPRNQKPRK